MESFAVESEAFVKKVKEKLGIRAPGRKVIGENGNCELPFLVRPRTTQFQ
jgi:hypothetical protein